MAKSYYRLLFFMCGQLGVMLCARFLFQWLPAYAAQSNAETVLFSAAVVSGLILGFRIFDAVTDPLAGMFADWWVTQGNNRKSILPLTFWLPATGLALVFLGNFADQSISRYLYLVSGLFLFFVGYTLYVIPLWSLVEDYSQQDLNVRRSLSNVLGLGLMLATVIGFTVTPILIENLGFADAALLIGAVAALLMLLPIYGEPDGIENNRLVSEQPAQQLWKALLASLKNRRFMSAVALLAGTQMCFTILTAVAPFLATRILGGSYSDVAFILGPLVLTSIPSFWLTARVSKSLGWESCLLVGCVGLLLVSGLTQLVGANLFVSAKFTAGLIFALGGPFIALVLAVEAEAVSDCAGSLTKVSTYFGIHNFIVKALNGLALAVTMLLVGSSKVSDTAQVHYALVAAMLAVTIGCLTYRAFKSE